MDLGLISLENYKLDINMGSVWNRSWIDPISLFPYQQCIIYNLLSLIPYL